MKRKSITAKTKKSSRNVPLPHALTLILAAQVITGVSTAHAGTNYTTTQNGPKAFSQGDTVTVTGTNAVGVSASANVVSGTAISISATGLNAIAGKAISAGTLSLTDSAIFASGSNSYALLSSGSGSTVTLTGGTASQLGNNGGVLQAGSNGTLSANNVALSASAEAIVVYAVTAGSITVNGGSISVADTLNNGGTALFAYGAGSSIVANNLNVSLLTDGGGAYAYQGGNLVLNSGTLAAIADNCSILYSSFATISATNETISVVGNGSTGAQAADSGGVVVLNGGSMTVTGSNGTGVAASNSGEGTAAMLSGTHVAITVIGDNSVGATAGPNGIVNLTGCSVFTTGTSSLGLYATGSTGSINADHTNVTVVGTGTNSNFSGFSENQFPIVAARADNGGALTLTSGTVASSGPFTSGILAKDPGTTVTSGSQTILISGSLGFAVGASDSAQVTVNSANITLNAALGVALYGINGRVDAQHLQISGSSSSSVAFGTLGVAALGSLITLNDVAIDLKGSAGVGVLAQGSSQVSGTNLRLTVSATNGLIAEIGQGGNLSLTNSKLTATSSKGLGIQMQSSTVSLANTSMLSSGNSFQTSGNSQITITSGTLSTQADNFSIDGGAASVNISGNTRIQNGGTLIRALNSSRGTFVLAGETVSGNILADTSSSLNVTLNHSAWTGQAFVVSNDAPISSGNLAPQGQIVTGINLTLNSSTWNLLRPSVVHDLTFSGRPGSTVNFLPPNLIAPIAAPGTLTKQNRPLFNHLTVTGAMTGGATFIMSTDLGKYQGDSLTLNGTSSGTYRILITNHGGAPAASGQAFDLVQTGSTSAAFVLANPGGFVEAGAFRYTLKKGTGSGATPSTTDEYLVGSGQTSTMGKAVVNLSGGQATSWFDGLDTLSARLGNLRLSLGINPQDLPPVGSYDGKNVAAPSKETVAPTESHLDFWVDSWGKRINATSSATQFAFGEYLYGSTFGVDNKFKLMDAWLFTGAFAGYGGRTFINGASGQSNIATGGLYATYIHKDGGYLDAVVKLDDYSNHFTTASNIGQLDHGDYSNWGTGFSLEAGKQFALKNAWFIEPQVQFAYSYLTGARYVTDLGSQIDAGAENAFQLRGGISVGRTIAVGRGVLQPYLKVSGVEVLSTGGQVAAEGTAIRASFDGWRVEASTGVAYQLDAANQIYAAYEFATADKYTQPWGANVGFRRKW